MKKLFCKLSGIFALAAGLYYIAAGMYATPDNLTGPIGAVSAVSEPGNSAMLLAGLGIMALIARRRMRSLAA